MGNDRAFTLRIGSAEDKELKLIKENSGETTDTGAIRFILRNWINLNKKLVDALKKNEELKKGNLRLQEKNNNFTNALEALKIK